MNRQVAIIEARSGDWKCYLKSQPAIWEAGPSIESTKRAFMRTAICSLGVTNLGEVYFEIATDNHTQNHAKANTDFRSRP